MTRRRLPGVRGRFVLIFLLLVVLPTASFISWFTHSYYNYALNSAIESKVNLLKQIEKDISARILNYRNTTLMFYYNESIMPHINSGDYRGLSEAVHVYLSSFVNTERHVINAMLRLDGMPPQYAGSTLLLDEGYFAGHMPHVLAARGRPVLLPTLRTATAYMPEVYVFAMARAINDPKGSVGTLWVFIGTGFFDDLLKEKGLYADDTQVHVLSGHTVIASNGDAQPGASMKSRWTDQVGQVRSGAFTAEDNGRDLVVAVSPIRQTDWHLVSTTPLQTILESVGYIRSMAALVFGLYAVFVAAMYLMLSRMMFRPLARLGKGLSKVASGDFAYMIPRTTDDEIGELTESYNTMTGRIQSLMDDVRNREREKNDATIQVLSMQIGSHFIYNTLNTIRWMAVMNKQPQIRDMVVSLIKLLMSVTYHNGGEISLREELELVRHYAVIQRARFANFQIMYDVPEELLKLSISKLILQPVIENSIIHGFSGRAAPGIITISARRQEDMLCITISDDGSGFDVSQIKWEDDRERADSVGLSNIHRRLVLNYGEGAGLSVQSTSGKGTAVTLRMPARDAPCKTQRLEQEGAT